MVAGALSLFVLWAQLPVAWREAYASGLPLLVARVDASDGATADAVARQRTFAPEDRSYPRSFVDRPLGMPEGMTQVAAAFEVDRAVASTTLAAINADYGVTDDLAAGVRAAWQTTPTSSLDYAVVDVQQSVARAADLRVEAGVSRSLGARGWVGAVGLPVRWKISPRIAFVSGRASYSFSEDNLVRVQLVERDGRVQRRISVFVPVGFVAQVHDRVGVGVRTGWRTGLADATGTQFPTAVDVVVAVAAGWDAGVSGEAFGVVDPAMRDEVGRDSAAVLAWGSARF